MRLDQLQKAFDFVIVDREARISSTAIHFHGVNKNNGMTISGCVLQIKYGNQTMLREAETLLKKLDTMELGDQYSYLRIKRTKEALFCIEEFPKGALNFQQGNRTIRLEHQARLLVLRQFVDMVELLFKQDTRFKNKNLDAALFTSVLEQHRLIFSRPVLVCLAFAGEVQRKIEWITWVVSAILRPCKQIVVPESVKNVAADIIKDVEALDFNASVVLKGMLEQSSSLSPLQQARQAAAELRWADSLQKDDPGSEAVHRECLSVGEQSVCTCKCIAARNLLSAIEARCVRCSWRFITLENHLNSRTPQHIYLLRAATLNLSLVVGMLLRDQIQTSPERLVEAYNAAFQAGAQDTIKQLQVGLQALPAKETAKVVIWPGLKCKCSARSTTLQEAMILDCVKCSSKFLRELGWQETKQQDKLGLHQAVEARSENVISFMRVWSGQQQDEQGKTALMRAVETDYHEVIPCLLKLAKNLKDNNGNTALMLAVKAFNYQAVKLLAPWESRQQNNDGDTALILAVRFRFADAVPLLAPLEAGMRNSQNQTALREALASLRFDYVQFLIKNADELNSAPQMSPVMKACLTNNAQLIKAEPSFVGNQTTQGLTALMIAAGCGHLECVRLLCEAEQHLTLKGGITAMNIAFFNNQTQAAITLNGGATTLDQEYESLEITARWSACICRQESKSLNEAATKGCLKCCYQFREEADKKLPDGQTAFMMAAKAGHADCVRYLHRYQGFMKTANNETALMFAAKAGRIKCVQILSKSQARTTDTNAHSALMYAAIAGHVECVECLLLDEAGMMNRSGLKARHLAINADQMECADLLCTHKAEQ